MFKQPQYVDKNLDKDLQEKLGGYNHMPPNWQTINEGEFLWRFGQKHAGGYQDYRQVILPTTDYHGNEVERFCHVHLWINMDLAGVGIISHYNGRCTDTDHGYKAQYFKFHYCDHDYETTHTANCYWEGVCKKCGYHHAIDSSD